MMLLEMAASGFGERVAFVDPAEGTTLTYQELFDGAAAAASAVRATGAERLAILDVNSVAFPVGLFASGWAGIPFVPINYRLTAEEIDALLGRIKPAYLVTEAHRVEGFDGDDSLEASARQDFLEIARSGTAGPEPWSMDPEDRN